MISNIHVILLVALVAQVQSRASVPCSFQKVLSAGASETKRLTCGYTKGWHEMQRANWNIVAKSRDGKVLDRSQANGFFAYFLAGKRPLGYISRFISPAQLFDHDDCVSFYYVNKGPKTPYPEGRSTLQVFLMANNKMPSKADAPLWTSSSRTSGNNWKRTEIQLFRHKEAGEKVRGRLVFVALRGKSKRSYLAIDDIDVRRCGAGEDKVQTYVIEEPAMRLKPKVESDTFTNPEVFLRELAAHRSAVQTRQFSASEAHMVDPLSPVNLPAQPRPRPATRRPSRKRGRSRGGRRGKGKKRKQGGSFGVVYFTEQPNQPASPNEPFIPTLIAQGPPQVLCDFMDYTHGVKRCLRGFFSLLRDHKTEGNCRLLYATLEDCLKTSATECVPSHEMSRNDVEELVTDTLRRKFKTKQVYCQEEGAFVFPEFSLGSLPLQCTSEYFMKLTECGGSFAGIFNIKHGDPKLCREYYTANECQRQTTAEECNFDTRTMLIYGLNLQYQFAHNPFCIDLPFSAWWPRK